MYGVDHVDVLCSSTVLSAAYSVINLNDDDDDKVSAEQHLCILFTLTLYSALQICFMLRFYVIMFYHVSYVQH